VTVTPEQNNNKVLIVEDEESNFELLKAMLRKRDVVVFWAQTGIEAIELCEQHVFSLILMDIKMPEMSGYAAIGRLREMGVTCPIIAQTAYARMEDEEKALKMGFNAYVSKPIDRPRLMGFIDEYLH
jgi:CheY-like chemotaxis protein